MTHALSCSRGWVYPLLVVLTVAVLSPVLHAGFVNYDDDFYYTANAHVQAPFSMQTFRWAFSSVYFNNWHPLAWLSHAADYHLFGMNARGPHAVNLLLHVLNTLLVFTIFRQAASGDPRATGAAALMAAIFAVHPLHVESVAWISERKDLLSGFFGLLAVWCYLDYVRRGRMYAYAAVAGCLLLSLMAKSMLVTLPCLLLLLDYWPLRRQRPGRLLLEKIPLLVIALATGSVAMALKTGQSENVDHRLLFVPIAYFRYLRKAFWPVDLAVYYPFPTAPIAPYWLLLCIAGLAGITLLAFVWRSRYPHVLCGWLWFAIALAPASGAVQIGGHCMADRYMYIPLIGLLMIVAWSLAKWPRRVAAAAGTALAVGAGVIGFAQAATWHDSVTLWEQGIRGAGSNGRAEYNLGNAWMERGQLEKAAVHYGRALDFDKTDIDASTNLGLIARQQKRLDDAVQWFQHSLAINANDARANYELGRLLKQRGQAGAAVPYLVKAADAMPGSTSALEDLANALMAASRFGDAAKYLTKLAACLPADAAVRVNLGIALARLDRIDDAVREFRAAIAIRPESADAHFNLGNALLRKKDMAGAAAEFQVVLAAKPEDADAHYGLGLACLGLDRKADAEQQFNEVLRLRPNTPEAARQLEALKR